MKTIFPPSPVLFILLGLYSQVQAQPDPVLTLVTSLHAKGAKQLVFQPSGSFELGYWEKDLIEVQIYIEDESFSRQQLKALLPIGFYKMESILDGTTLRIYMPNQDKEITINGKIVNNTMKFLLKIPTNMMLEYHTPERIGL